MKQVILYHGTDFKSAENIMKKGFESHTWFATNSKIARKFGSFKTDNPIILQIEINQDEIKKRALVKQPSSGRKSLRVIGYEYLLHSYRLPKLKPITLETKSDLK